MHEESNPQIVRRWNWWFLGGFLVVVLLALGGLHLLHSLQKSRLAVDHREAAFRLYDEGRYAEALEHLGHVLQTSPNDLDAVLAFARSVSHIPAPTAQQQLGQLAQYRRAIVMDPSDETVASEGLELFLSLELWLESSEIAERVLGANGSSKAALLALARVEMHEELDAEAEQRLLLLRELHPADDEGLRLLVSLLRGRAADQSITQRGETLRQLDDYVQETVEAHGQSNPRLYLIRAEQLERGGDEAGLALARADYERALDLLPESAEVATAAGRFYRRLGEFDLAVRWLTLALEADPTAHNTYALLAQSYSDRGRFGDAERVLREALQNCPRQQTILRFYMAETLLTAGDHERVRQIIEALTSAQVPIALTRYLEGRLHLSEGRPSKAVGIFESIADPVVTPMSHYFLAQAYMQLGQPDRAWARIIQVPREQFDPLVLGRLQLDVLAGNGMYREVIRKADELIAEFPDDADLLFLKADGLMGLLLSGEGLPIHLEQLSRLHERLLTVAGADVRVRLLRSRIEQLAGRRDQAYYNLEEALADQPAALELYAELVRLHLQDNQVGRALEVLEAAPEEVRSQAIYRVLVARAHQVSGDLDRAVTVLTRGLEPFPANERRDLQRLAASMLQRADRVEEAVQVLVTVAGENPNDIELRVAMLSMGEIQRQPELRDRLIGEIRRTEEALGEESVGAVWRIEQGRAHLLDPQHADPQQALALLQEVLQLQPQNEKALHLLARTYRELDQLEEAIAAALEALRAQPQQHLTKLLLVDLYGRAERHDEAGALIDELSGLEGPKPVMLVQDRLSWNLRSGRTTSAIDDARMLVAADPTNPRLRVLLSRLLASEGQQRQALDQAQQAVALEPGSTEAAVTLVGLALQLDEIDLARDAVDAFAQETDRPEAAYLLRSDIYDRLGETEQVLAVMQEGIEATGAATIMVARARQLAALDRLDEALTQYGRVPNEAAEAPLAALEAAEIMLRQGDPDRRAAAKIAQAEQLGAPRLDLLTLRWMLLGVTRPPGWLEQAVPILQEMTQLPGVNAQAFLDLAQVYLGQGALPEAARTLDAGLALFPDHLGLNVELASLYVRLGQLDQARIKAAYIGSLPEGEVPSKLLQVDVYEAQQNFQPAIVQLKSMMRERADDPQVAAWRLRALGLLERLDDQAGIRRMLEETPIADRDEALLERWAVHLLR
ncbi:MAG: tetratricopeptide repeat protein, partial [Phycisphaerales bacterium JB038]